jgi:hypothetical protein
MAYEDLIMAYIGVAILIGLAAYVYFAIALMTIAQKLGNDKPWLAWIPIGNLYLLTELAQVPWWSMFAFLLVFVPFIGSIGFMVVQGWWWWKISENRGHPSWFGILMVIIPVNFVIVGLLAWKDA